MLQLTGLLQALEWAALDQAFRLRPLEPVDKRILIVGIGEGDLQRLRQWPITDANMAQLLQKLSASHPRAIGLDIYRDLPVEPGHSELVKTFRALPNLIGIEGIEDAQSSGVPPPPVLQQQDQVGFNNVVVDSDGKVRRSLLYLGMQKSFALQLALIYLQREGIPPRPATTNPDYLQLGQGIFRLFESNDGAYVQAAHNGYQILSNFRGGAGYFDTVSLSDVLNDRVSPNLIRDRIVLIGSTAVSLKDTFYTPYSGGVLTPPQEVFGVELQANFVSEILSAAIDGRHLINIWADPVEWLWILGWSWLGAILSWKVRSPRWSSLSILFAGGGLTGICYLAFLAGWWIPFVAPLLGLGGAAIMIVAHIAQLEEELKRSKDFLHKVINTIPDPIFVKDQEHRWIVLNEAFCKFIGHPLETLIEKSDYDFFPKPEADVFWDHDIVVFNSGEACESEEGFTTAHGNMRLIATKRSLHKDAAGNLFLVGVIRDITERKRLEEELKRTAAELEQSNAELKNSEGRLRQLAYHDPLTGLPNRKLFYERLAQSVEAAHTHNQLVAILFLDLDGFKLINDSRGHDVGDLLLKAVAQRLLGCLRGSDTVCRLGGDEFTVILPTIPGVQDAARVAEKILTTLVQPFVLEGHTVSITTSIGISLYPHNGEEIDALIKDADTAMYRAKERGKNRYEFL